MGIAIGNGWIDSYNQYTSYKDFAINTLKLKSLPIVRTLFELI